MKIKAFKIKDFDKLEKYFFALFLLVSFVSYLLWSLNIPFGEAPDEAMRYQIPDFIYRYGYLPVGDDPEIINPVWGISYAFTPITTYIVQAFFMKITSFFTTDSWALIMTARIVNILFSVITLWICILISQLIFKKNYTAKWLFLFAVAFLPQYAFVSSYVNMDVLAVLSSAIIVYAWISGLKTDWDYKSCIVLAVGMSVCLLSYYNAYGFLLCSVLLYFGSMLCCNKNLKQIKFFKKTALIVFVVLLLSAWWFIRNFFLYDGDILGLAASNECADIHADAAHKLDALDIPKNKGQSLWYMLKDRMWLFLVARSFIGLLGHANVALSTWVYLFYALFFVASFVGCLISFKKFFPKIKSKLDEHSKKTILFSITMIIAVITPFLISMYYSYTADFQPQGRYSIPCLIPLMFFSSVGFNSLFSKLLPQKFESKLKNISVVLVMTIMLFFIFKILTGTIIPVYQGA
ncbi:MAG: hypothetical protein Q4B14_05925 [Clostridia bacterium]|nr:hypothetical protein [Clostridia bacterium]